MSYTPINWQTGDTITADKLNKMDNGWGVESTQLFSETVTTEYDEDMAYGTFTYSSVIDADALTVTFNGTEYSCPRKPSSGGYFYGSFSAGKPDFSEYPFAIQSSDIMGNMLYTENAGTYTIAVVAQTAVISANFEMSVTKSKDFVVVPGVTTWEEVHTALLEGCNCYTLDGATDYAQKKIILYALWASESVWRIYGVELNANNLGSVYYTATSADGVLS